MVGDGFALAALCALMALSGSQASRAQVEPQVSAALASSARTSTGHAGHAHTGRAQAGHAQAGHAGAGQAGAGHPRGHLKAVRYRGYSFLVPRSWPVVNDRTRSRGCVRFDQHAVYLGAVRGDEFCPSWLLGTTESILIQPGPARSLRGSAENPVARQITARAPGIAITATFATDPTVIYRILASASLPPPAILADSGAKAAAGHLDAAASRADRAEGGTPGSPRMRQPMPMPPLPTAVASLRGLGFDACTAPSRGAMRAWRRRSPYRAIGIYIGGADRACAQPNLSQAWVRAEARAGWRFIPLYAGPQAVFGELRAPVRQGLAAARDAAAQARRLGFGRRTPIYYDMEAYNPGVRIAALRFLSAWTRELHRLRYSSGVYSSSDSGIVDLSRQYARRTYAMPNVIYDALWNGSASTSDRNLRAGQWHLKRIHQFSGNVTQRFGGHTINIDKDFLDVRLQTPFTTSQATSAVTLPDGSVDLFYRLHDSQLWFDRFSARTGWARPVRTGAQASSVPSVVSTGSAVDVFYTRAGGSLWVDSYLPDGKLTARHELSMMGVLGSAPRAVAQPGGVIDVFWHGSADDHLWHGQYVPGAGWFGPQGLGGDLGSDPVPVVSSPGTTTVLWKGRDASLWCVSRGVLGRWSAPRSLGMGPLGGQPQATAQPTGGIQVYWHGSGNSFVWEGFYRPGTGWLGPRDLGGETRSVPWPATAVGTVRVLWRGPGNKLTYIRHRLGRRWNLTEWQGPLPLRTTWLGSAPFAAVGSPGAALQVFWPGRHDRLWTAALRAGGWTKPTRIAG